MQPRPQRPHASLAVVAALVTLICGCAGTSSTRGGPQRGEAAADPELVAARMAFAGRIREAALVTARRSGDATARRIAEFLRTNGVVAGVTAGQKGLMLHEAPGQRGNAWLLLVPVMTSELAADPLLAREFIRQTSLYLERFRALVVPDLYGDPWLGILALHEGFHAEAHARRDYRALGNDEGAEEVSACDLQYALQKAVGGDVYRAVLHDETVRVERGFLSYRTKMTFPEPSPYDPRLDAAFGPAKSALEIESRRTSLWVAATFDVMSRKERPEDVARAKASLLLTLASQPASPGSTPGDAGREL